MQIKLRIHHAQNAIVDIIKYRTIYQTVIVFIIRVKKDAVECKECPNCENTNWVNSSTGYQSRNVRTCNYTTCVCNPQIQIEFRCAAGYYGTAAPAGQVGVPVVPALATVPLAITAQSQNVI